MVLDGEPGEPLNPLPESTNVAVGSVGAVEPVAVQDLFKYGFENVYKFQKVSHTCEVSKEAINQAIAADEEPSDSETDLQDDFARQRQISNSGDPLRMPFGPNLQTPGLT